MMAGQSARRKFLSRLIREVRHKSDLEVSFRFRNEIRSYGVEGVVARVAALPGPVEIVPCVIDPGGVDRTYKPFPGRGQPHYELLLSLLEDPAEVLEVWVAHDVEHALEALRHWREHYKPKPKQRNLPPFTQEELQYHEAIAEARATARAMLVVVDVDLTKAPGHMAAQVRRDTKNLDRLGIARNFPRQPDGRLPLNTVVLLTQYEESVMLNRDRLVWLAAHSPSRRADPQVITIQLLSLIGANHPHNWSTARLYWDRRERDVPEETQWSLPGTAVRRARFGIATPNLLVEKAKARALSPVDRAALCLCWLDQARFKSALDLYGIGLQKQVRDALADKTDENGWATSLRKALWESAPWLLQNTLCQEGQRLRQWTAAKKSRSNKAPELRLFALPKQHHQKKVSLCLSADDCEGRGAEFRLQLTASNDRLAEVFWKRPVEVDLLRLGLLAS